MKRYLLVLKFFLKTKFIFKNPPQRDLVIFDDVSIFDLKNLIHHYNFFIMQNRGKNINKIYFSFKIFKHFFKNYKGNVMTSYLVSLLEIINPRVVLTNIDNSYKFFELARALNHKINFVAIQNTVRFELKEHEHRYERNLIQNDITKKFYIPNFLCFGQVEIDTYNYYKINVENFYKVGSLRLANVLYHIKKNKIKLKESDFDICLISEPALHRNEIFGEKNIEKGFADMTKFTIKFCMKNNMKLVFAWKREKKTNPDIYKKEIDFYKKYLTNDELNYLFSNSSEKINENYTSYMAMFRSKVVVGFCSTILRENLAIGGKILSCNLTSTNIWDFPIEGICSIKNCSYEEFEKRLNEIYLMSKEDYFLKLNKDKSYAMEYDEKISTIELVKNKIDYFLSNGRSLKI